jgi:hypothetical protein
MASIRWLGTLLTLIGLQYKYHLPALFNIILQVTHSFIHSFQPLQHYILLNSHSLQTTDIMVAFTLTSLLLGAGALVSAAPSSLDTRASCTFTDAATAIKNKASCSAIIIKDMTVPAGTTLDLTKLKTGTSVTFQGTTTFGYKEWEGPLISVSGTNLKVTGAAGHVINGAGEKWWDGKGTNGGKTKPKVR